MDLAQHFANAGLVSILEGANEQKDILDLKSMGIGSHSTATRATPRSEGQQRSPTSVESKLS